MSSNLYSFSSETLARLKKFRFQSARVNNIQALIYTIDKDTYEVKEDEDIEENPLNSIEDLIQELPDNAPRYIILSYPLKTKDGRLQIPLVMLYWLPPTTPNDKKMLFAGAVENFRDKAGVSKLIKISDEEEFEDLETQIS
ncbi:uncharacterized protein KGF55_002806 [Candida pseudojiufengensis]|uniref:uncharacterized protein n=1 Tax=Candida pseudojiufengensis TaxID=497109 RepID=UPI002225127A|nr:uncharacterized protein KGF55_002806 [Candida pseudojiufengensis]KAI5963014.1 hypothetical protein KGF55_002806 [Candida pseudojiufengensis]